MAENSDSRGDIEALLTIMERLRDPHSGCPWDVQQTFVSVAPYTIEEAYEVADAIERHDLPALKEELGDLLLQVVFHARMAQEQGAFDFHDVVAAISAKMVRRHPHVFPDSAGQTVAIGSPDEQTGAWEEHKRLERAQAGEADTSALAGITRGLPEWQRAVKLQKRAARVGFDWPDVAPVIAKLHEEIEEVRAEFAARDATPDEAAVQDRLEDEIGDVLFVCANLARHASVDPGSALRRANRKFERRFRTMESMASADGQSLAAQSLDTQETYWQRAKQEEGR